MYRGEACAGQCQSVKFISMRIILDGYNVAHKIPEVRDRLKESLEKGRTALENHLASWKRLRNFAGNITIVYDGQKAGGAKRHGFEYIFTGSSEEADDRIIRIIRNQKNPDDLIVVSDDNKVRNSCRALGVKVEPASYLLIERSAKSPKKYGRYSEKPVSPPMSKITKELKKEWGV